MPHKYIDVAPSSELFVAATRAFGDIAVAGKATAGALNVATPFTDSGTALTTFPGDVGNSIRMAFSQTPGPTKIWGLRIDEGASDPWPLAFNEIAKQDVQIVLVANTPLTTPQVSGPSSAAINALSNHVTLVSGPSGGDGKERIGVAMLPSGGTDLTPIIVNERVVYVAHRATKNVPADPEPDAAAAVAGVIAGYEPHISILLKPVNIHQTQNFTDSEIDAFDQKGVNWLTDPILIPGSGVYMGEGYTGDHGGTKRYIDVVRALDDITFRIKAELIRAIGNLRVNRTGLGALATLVRAVLAPLQAREVIDGFAVHIPLLVLLDKNPDSLTPAELTQIQTAQSNRRVDMSVTVDYAGAIHQLHIDLVFK